MDKLRERLAKLRVLKFERATEMVGLVVDCQNLFRHLGLTETNPLQTKVSPPPPRPIPHGEQIVVEIIFSKWVSKRELASPALLG